MLPEVFPHPSNSLNSGVPVCAVATGVGKQAPGVQTASANRNGRSQGLSEVYAVMVEHYRPPNFM